MVESGRIDAIAAMNDALHQDVPPEIDEQPAVIRAACKWQIIG